MANHTHDKQIGLPLRGPPSLLVTRMITDPIGLHSVLLPLQISARVLKEILLNRAEKILIKTMNSKCNCSAEKACAVRFF